MKLRFALNRSSHDIQRRRKSGGAEEPADFNWRSRVVYYSAICRQARVRDEDLDIRGKPAFYNRTVSNRLDTANRDLPGPVPIDIPH